MNLKFDQQKIEEICKKYKVEFLGVFGSVARGDDNPESDVDLLVRFAKDDTGGLLELVEMQFELEDVVGKKVDLVTERILSKYFRDEVLAETKPIYAKA